MTTEQHFRLLYIGIFFLSVVGWGLFVGISGNDPEGELVGQVSDAFGAITGTALVAILAIEGMVIMLARDSIKNANERRDAAEARADREAKAREEEAKAREAAEAREANLLALLEQHGIEVLSPNGHEDS